MSNRLPNSTRKHESDRLSRVRQRQSAPGRNSRDPDQVASQAPAGSTANELLPKPLVRIPRLGDVGPNSQASDVLTTSEAGFTTGQPDLVSTLANSPPDVPVAEPIVQSTSTVESPHARTVDPSVETGSFEALVELPQQGTAATTYSSASSSVLNEIELSALGCHPLQAESPMELPEQEAGSFQARLSGDMKSAAAKNEAIADPVLGSTPVVLSPAAQPKPAQASKITVSPDSAELAKAKRQRMMYEILFQVALTIALIGMLLFFHALVSGTFARDGGVQEDSMEAPTTNDATELDELGGRLDPAIEESPAISSSDRPRIRVTGLENGTGSEDGVPEQGAIRQATYEDRSQSSNVGATLGTERQPVFQQTVPQTPPRHVSEPSQQARGTTAAFPNHLYSRTQTHEEYAPAQNSVGDPNSNGGLQRPPTSNHSFRQPAASGNQGLRMP